MPDDRNSAGKVEGLVAVVTGGATGIGRAIAERFVAEGARVVVGQLPAVRVRCPLRLVRALSGAVVVVALAFILTLYLLIEGRRTYAWLVAFVPKSGSWLVSQ